MNQQSPQTPDLSNSRRQFIKASALTMGALFIPRGGIMAGPFTGDDFRKLVPLDKKLSEAWIRSLTERGASEIWKGADLRYTGMPCNGIATGQVYFGGDGRLWRWAQLSPDDSGGIKTSGARYKNPDDPAANQAIQGAALKVTNRAGVTFQRKLDKESFPETEFSPRWPIGIAKLSAKDFPIETKIQGWSPFIPGKLEDSSWPVSVLSYHLTNTYNEPLTVELAVWLDNVLAASATGRDFGVRRINAVRGDWAGGQMVALSAVQDDSLSPAETIAELRDYGTMAIAVLGNSDAGGFAGAVQASSDETIFDARMNKASAPLSDAIRSVVGRKLELAPEETAQIDVVVSWNMPVNPVRERNDYATRWTDAAATLIDFEPRFRDLAAATEAWARTWYDNSSLPHWLMQRAAIPANCLQTQTTTKLANRDGLYHLWEGGTCCQGNCTHVWHYAQASARLFPELERQCRERIDLGLGLNPEGRMAMRWSAPDRTPANTATDGTAGTIMRVFREHQMSADDGFLRRVWPAIKRVVEYQIHTYDPDMDGILTGGQRNTLDAEWFGKIPWITSLHLGALQASVMMAEEMDDAPFAERCRKSLESGRAKFVAVFYDAKREYFVMREDPAHPKSPGTYNGCHIDQVMGQGWAWQIGMPRVLPEAETRTALQSIWNNNFTPDVRSFRKQFPQGRWYSVAGEGGTMITTFPDGGAEDALNRGEANHSAYMNETMTGFEWQVSAHMVWEGMLKEGLAVGKAIADRYAPEMRNPFNEIECGDHYSRAMASYGTFLAVCGFTYHGPKGILGYAPKIRPEAFMAPFTAAEGWGSLQQSRKEASQINRITLRHGQLVLNQLNLELPAANAQLSQASLGSQPLKARIHTDGTSCSVHFEEPVTLHSDETLELSFTV